MAVSNTKLRQVAVRYNKGEEDPKLDTNLIGASEQNHNLTDVMIKLQQSNYSGSGNYLGLELNNTATNVSSDRTRPRAPTMKTSLTRLQEARDALTTEARAH